MSGITTSTSCRSRRYALRLLRFFFLSLLAFSLTVTLFGLVQTIRWANLLISPPHHPLARTPSDEGISSYQEVSFTSSDGTILRGWYIPSRNGAAIILCHGLAANRTQALPEARALTGQGYGVLLFDWRAHGESGGEFSTMGVREQMDLRAAVDFVVAQPDVDPNRIGTLGFSLGGATIVLAAPGEPRLKAVIVEAAFTSLDEMIDRMGSPVPGVAFVTSTWGRIRTGIDPSSVRPIDVIGQIRRPLLLIYGGQDGLVTPESARRMAAAASEPNSFWLIENGGHGEFSKAAGQEYERRIVEFFDETLSHPPFPPLPTHPSPLFSNLPLHFRLFLRPPFLQKGHNLGDDFGCAQSVRRQIQIAISPGVGQAASLFSHSLLRPVFAV